MPSQQKNLEYAALCSWALRTEWQVFGTLKFVNADQLPKLLPRKIAAKFFNKLDQVVYGKNYAAKGYRIQRFVCEQYGFSGTNVHYHFVANPFQGESSNAALLGFCETAKCIWEEAHERTNSFINTDIAPVRDSFGAATYCFHEHANLKADTLMEQFTHTACETTNEAALPKIRRALRRQIVNEPVLERAEERARTKAMKEIDQLRLERMARIKAMRAGNSSPFLQNT